MDATFDLTEAEVGIALAADWYVVAETIEYAPVGFGGHHWVLTERPVVGGL